MSDVEPVGLAEFVQNYWDNVTTADAPLVTEGDAQFLADPFVFG